MPALRPYYPVRGIVCVNVSVCVRVCEYDIECVYMRVRACTSVYTHIHVCVCMFVHVYVHILTVGVCVYTCVTSVKHQLIVCMHVPFNMMGVCAHTLEAPTMAVWPATAMKPSTCTPSSLEERKDGLREQDYCAV